MAESGVHASTGNAGSTEVLAVARQDSGDSVSVVDLAIVAAKHKKLVLGFPVLAALVALGVAFFMDNWYAGVTKLLPPQQSQSNAIAILGQLGVLSGNAGQALGIKNPSDIFVGMLKSRTITDRIVARFDLLKEYDEKLLTDARKELRSHTSITSARDGIITIEVEDRIPERAAQLANAYVEELEALTLQLAITEAGQRRLFFEKQLAKSKDDLAKAELELQVFQESNNIVSASGQASLTVAASAGLRAQVTAKEIQIAAIGAFATDENPDLVRAQEELAALRAQLVRMNRSSGDGDVLLSLKKAPEKTLEYVRRFRDMKYHETLFELLAKQYELARIDEAKNATLIQVLEKAIAPEKKARPKRLLIVLVTGLIAAMLSFVIACILEWAHLMAKDERSARKLAVLRQYWRAQ